MHAQKMSAANEDLYYRLLRDNCASFVMDVCKDFVQQGVSGKIPLKRRGEETDDEPNKLRKVAESLITLICPGAAAPASGASVNDNLIDTVAATIGQVSEEAANANISNDLSNVVSNAAASDAAAVVNTSDTPVATTMMQSALDSFHQTVVDVSTAAASTVVNTLTNTFTTAACDASNSFIKSATDAIKIPFPKYIIATHDKHKPTVKDAEKLEKIIRDKHPIPYDQTTTNWNDIHVVSKNYGRFRHVGLVLFSGDDQYCTIGQGMLHYGDWRLLSSMPDWTNFTKHLKKITSPDKSLALNKGTDPDSSLQIHAKFSDPEDIKYVIDNLNALIARYDHLMSDRVQRAIDCFKRNTDIPPGDYPEADFITAMMKKKEILQFIIAMMFCYLTLEASEECAGKIIMNFFNQTKPQSQLTEENLKYLYTFIFKQGIITKITALDMLLRSD